MEIRVKRGSKNKKISLEYNDSKPLKVPKSKSFHHKVFLFNQDLIANSCTHICFEIETMEIWSTFSKFQGDFSGLFLLQLEMFTLHSVNTL